MNWFSLISAVLLSIILGWTIYHVRILFAGIRNKSTRFYSNVQELPKFSLIVPAKDEGPVIARCLDALLDMEYPREKMEIIVVEGASKDSTREICQNFAEKHPASIKILCEKASNGKPAALNFALPHVTGEIVGVFDADSIPEKSALQKMVSYFQDKAVTAVQGSTTSLNAKQNMLTQIASMEDRAWFQGLIGGREKLKLFVPLTGSCQFIRSDVLKEMGGWDESSLAEDVELALKLTEKGHLVKFAPDISSGQETPSKIRDLITQRTRWYRGYMEAAFKHGRLAEKPNRKNIDAELSLIGPFIMVICLASYFNWAFSMVFSVDNTIFPISATLVVALTSLTLLSLGVSLVFLAKPVKLKNIFWVPFVYLYWLMQMTLASWAFLQILFRRRRVWGKTAKIGFMTPIFRARSSPELRVAFVSSYPPNRGRLSEYARSLVNELSNRPAIGKMYLLVDQAANAPENLKEDPKVKILRVWKPDDFLSIIGILKHILKLRPHLVHFNVHFQSYGKTRLANFTGLSLIFFSRLLGFKVLAEVHNLGEKVDLKKVQLKPSLLNKVGILVATKLILSAPRVVVTVRSYAEYLKERYGHLGVQYIPHGTLAGNYSIVDPEEKIILLFGHMGPYKGLPVMLKAFEEMRKENYNVKLIVAGSSHPNFPGFLDPYIKANIPKVDFMGYVPEEDIARVFRMADVVVIPYFTTTGTSGVFHLACGYGRPIVASDLPELREILAEGASALLVPPDNVKALKDGILKVLSDEKMAAKMSAQNLRFAQGESWGIVAKAYEEAYLELLTH